MCNIVCIYLTIILEYRKPLLKEKRCPLENHVWLIEDDLLGPKIDIPVDASRSDAELFQDYFLLDGAGRKGLGDLWEDVSWLNSKISNPCCKIP